MKVEDGKAQKTKASGFVTNPAFAFKITFPNAFRSSFHLLTDFRFSIHLILFPKLRAVVKRI